MDSLDIKQYIYNYSKNKANNVPMFGISSILIMLFIMFSIFPSVKEIIDLREKANMLDKAEKIYSSKADTLGQLNSIYTDETIELVKLAIPDNPDEPGLLKSLEKIATTNRIIIKNLAFNQMEGKGSYAELGINLTIVGTYSDVVDYLAYLDNILREIVIHSVSIKSENGIYSQSDIVEASISATSFYISNSSEQDYVDPR